MQLLKLTFCVYRPWIRDPGIVPVGTASGYSFPSGHSVTGASNYGTVLARYGKKHRGLGALMAVMLLLTMFSRNYIGVHTPQDVAAGAALTALFLVYIGLKNYPMDYDEAGKLLVDPVKMMKDGWKDAGRLLGVSQGWIGFALTFGELMLLMVVYPLCFSRLEGRRSAYTAPAA